MKSIMVALFCVSILVCAVGCQSSGKEYPTPEVSTYTDVEKAVATVEKLISKNKSWDLRFRVDSERIVHRRIWLPEPDYIYFATITSIKIIDDDGLFLVELCRNDKCMAKYLFYNLRDAEELCDAVLFLNKYDTAQ